MNIKAETKEKNVDMQAIVDRILSLAGKCMNDQKKPTNPNLTARERIALADYIAALESEYEERCGSQF